MLNLNKKLKIKIKCHDLDPQNQFNILNPCVIVSEQTAEKWIQKGQTEIKQNERNPIFQQEIDINYEFQVQFQIKFDIYHVMSEKKQLLIGSNQTNIQSLLTPAKQIYRGNIILNNCRAGRISVFGEYQNTKSPLVELNITATYLLLRKWCIFDIRPQNPFIKIFRQIDQQENTLVCETNCINYPNKKTWPTIKVKGNKLCNNNFDDVLRFEIYDKKNNNQNSTLGEIRLSINQILESQNQTRLLRNENNQINGQVKLNCNLIEQPTFEEYIKGGFQLNLMIAIDFTDSNKPYDEPESLHCFNYENRVLSQYEVAMMTVAKILIEYDHDKKVPLFGFGCVPEGEHTEQFCYPLNGNKNDPEVHKLIEIFQTYRNFVPRAKFSKPSIICPCINKAADYAKKFKDDGNNNYVVLTLLTNGIIDDFAQAVEKIIRICDLPISIIIIGVGDGDFGKMQKLDNQPSDELGTKVSRDLVKFVKFKDFYYDTKKLASEVLSELPDQVVQYMQSVNKQPNQLQGNTIAFLNEENPNNQYFQEPLNNDNLKTISRLIYGDEINFENQIVNSEQVIIQSIVEPNNVENQIVNPEQVMIQSIVTPKNQYYVRLKTND